MGFCTQCGNSFEADMRFCGKCGAEFKKQEMNNSSKPVNEQLTDLNNKVVVGLQNINSKLNWKKQKFNKKVIGVTVLVLIIGFYMFSPKQLTVEEYEELALELLLKNDVAMDIFSNEIDNSGVHIGLYPDWSEDYRQLVKPAEDLEKELAKINKTLEGIKPPEYFIYEHENLLKAFSAHKSMASYVSSYMEDGNLDARYSYEEYEDIADGYFDKSFFLTGDFEE